MVFFFHSVFTSLFTIRPNVLAFVWVTISGVR